MVFNSPLEQFALTFSLGMKSIEKSLNYSQAFFRHIQSNQTYMSGIMNYFNEFMVPYWTALDSFLFLEQEKLRTHCPG